MTATRIVPGGSSFEFIFDRSGESITGWVCTISVKKKYSDTSAITPRVIVPTDNRWEGFITQTESAGLASGLYRLIADLANTGTDEKEQPFVRFNIAENRVV